MLIHAVMNPTVITVCNKELCVQGGREWKPGVLLQPELLEKVRGQAGMSQPALPVHTQTRLVSLTLCIHSYMWKGCKYVHAPSTIFSILRCSVVDPDPDCIRIQWGPGSGSRRAKMTHKHRKKLINLIFFEVLDVPFLRVELEGFSCSLDVLYGFFYQKKIFGCFCLIFSHQNPGSGFTWNVDPDLYPDPELCLQAHKQLNSF